MSKFFTKYNPPPKVDSPSGDVSLTDSQYLGDCDINNIIKRYTKGDMSAVRSGGVFGDVSGLGDFRECMEKVRNANEAFASLPAEVRDRFSSDPALLIDFLRDSKNDEEAIKLGLKVAKPVEKSVEEQVKDGVMAANAAAASAQSEAGRDTPTT